MSPFLQVITSDDSDLRNTPLDALCADLSPDELLAHCSELDTFRRHCDNLYERVRALFFLYAIYRFHLPQQLKDRETGHIPFSGFEQMLSRRYPESLETFLARQAADG